MGKRCQVCDGPVANGRCRLCGMPYRNDEILYHLNENRSDHYRHATPKAREIMRRMEVPQKGQTPEKKAAARNQSVSRQEKIQKKNYTTGEKRNVRTYTTGEKRNVRDYTAVAKGNVRNYTEKSGSKAAVFAAILIFAVIVLIILILGFAEYSENKINDITWDDTVEIGDIYGDETQIPEDALYRYTLFEVGDEMTIGETVPAIS
ncbi:MAG: hypothetical protein Q4C91_14550 [Eubacteriales bacterium]|nr:hypothetical protein [Eubacteriales bacterium]